VEEKFVVLEIDGEAVTVSLSDDNRALLIDGEYVPYAAFSEGGTSYYRLTDGRIYKDLTKDYVDVLG
jgi:hypothetical protein